MSNPANLEISLDAKGDPLVRQVGQDLAKLYKEFQVDSPISIDSNSLLQTNEDQVAIEAIAIEDGESLVRDLEALGLENTASFGKVVNGSLPVTAIKEMANLDSLNFARPAYKPFTKVGETTSQADISLNADDARSDFAVDGSGITIGVLSDSYNNLDGASDGVASGDIPGEGNPFNNTPVEVLKDLSSGDGSDEGRAMIELIHDVAPRADLAFRTAFEGAADFATGIGELVDAGADIIVDDIGYLTQPFFQDGVIAQAADDAAEAGVPVFSAAGNSGRDSYESEFRESGTTLDLNNDGNAESLAHDFNPNSNEVDIFQEFTLADGETINLSFQWDQPHAQAGGAGSANDMDAFVLNSAQDTILAGSANNNIDGDAVERLVFQNTTGSEATFNLLFTQFLPAGGPTPGKVKYIDFAGGTSEAEFATNSSTSFGHPNAADAAGVGAAFYQQTPEFGQDPPLLESFSSAGGTPILFDTAGNSLPSPEIRPQPRFVAPDGTNTTFFGNQINDGDNFPNFFGTSAAAPHAAAVASLMLDAAGGPGSLSPEEVYTTLEESAIDMESSGFDFDSGSGLIQADAAVEAVLDEPDPNLPPEFDEDEFTFEIAELGNASNGDEVGTIAVSDPEGDDLTLSFTEEVSEFDLGNDGNLTIAAVEELELGELNFTVEAEDEFGNSSQADVTINIDSPSQLLEQIRSNIEGIEIDDESINFIGAAGSTSFFDSITFGENANLSESGILLTSGDGTPPPENTEPQYTIVNGSDGDPELTEIVQNAFPAAGTTNDAAILELSFSVENPQVESISFDVLFGSEEFPEFIDSPFVDIAAITVNGDNFAFLDGDPNKPLSVVDATIQDGRFLDNTDGTLPIEYNGISTQTRVTIPLDQVPANENEEGRYDVRIGVADTGDFVLDSGFFISNFQTSESGAGGTQVIIEADDQGSDLKAPGDNTATLFIGGPGDDTMIGSTAPDTYNLNAGGNNLVQGSLEQLNEDTILDFDSNDIIKVFDTLFNQDQLTVTQGSAILEIDANDDDQVDSKITLEGDYSNGEFVTKQTEGDTEISFETPSGEISLNQETITFQTPLSQFREGAEDSELVRANPNGEDIGNTLVTETLTISNSGGGDLTLQEIQLPDIDGLTLTENPVSDGDEILAPNSSVTATFAFSPIEAGIDLEGEQVTVVSDDQNVNVNLLGRSTYASDISYDGRVNLTDLGPLNASFGTTEEDENYDPTADINLDGRVNLTDLGPLNAEFGNALFTSM